MAETHEVDRTCPVCGGTMFISRLTCHQCASALEGAFHLRGMPSGPLPALPGARGAAGAARGARAERAEDEARFGRLARLDAAQLDFVEAFLRCRGVIKNVEDMLGISYPTVKARLADVLNAMGFGPEEDLPDGDRRRERREILADLAAGRISTEDAHRLLGRGPSTTDTTDAE
ncbi:MAG TPA: DUF2089 domain-containing protein [Ktedonobacterales bacterium]|nr:DUF2089 domain-containing protein [Ktedonobacterales bacterium]